MVINMRTKTDILWELQELLKLKQPAAMRTGLKEFVAVLDAENKQESQYVTLPILEHFIWDEVRYLKAGATHFYATEGLVEIIDVVVDPSSNHFITVYRGNYVELTDPTVGELLQYLSLQGYLLQRKLILK